MIGSPIATAEPKTSSRMIDRRQNADLVAVAGVRLRQLLADIAAHGGLQARLLRGIGSVQDRVRFAVGEAALSDVERHRDVADLLVLAELRGALGAQRAHRGVDVSGLLQVADRRRDRVRVLGVGELPRVGRDDEGVRAVRLGREAPAEEVAGVLAAGAGSADVVGGLRAHSLRGRHNPDDQYQPDREHDEAPARAEMTELVQEAGHLNLSDGLAVSPDAISRQYPFLRRWRKARGRPFARSGSALTRGGF